MSEGMAADETEREQEKLGVRQERVPEEGGQQVLERVLKALQRLQRQKCICALASCFGLGLGFKIRPQLGLRLQ